MVSRMDETPEVPLTTKEVAVLLRVSRMTVSRWADEGRLPYFTVPSGRRRFYRSAIDAFIARRTVSGDAA